MEIKVSHTNLLDALMNQGFVKIRFKPILEFSNKILGPFHVFVEEDVEYKSQWTFHKPGSLMPDHGYVPPKGEGYDHKNFFHYSYDLPELLAERGVQVNHFYKKWLADQKAFSDIIINFMADMIVEFAERKQWKSVNLLERFYNAKLMHKMRLLDYFCKVDGKENKVLAKAHKDQSFLTFHWFQSHGGLMLGKEGKSIPYTCEAGDMLIFFGRKAEESSGGLVKALPHYALAEHGLDTNRKVAVFFGHIDWPLKELR